MSDFVTVAREADLAPGKGLMVEVGGKEIALFNVEGRLYAMDNRCPHRGGPLAQGFLHGGKVECPWHGWMFDLQNGASSINPRVVQPCYELRVEDGNIQIKTR